MSNNTNLVTLEQKVRSLPSTSNEALFEIIQGLYQGKPLLGTGGLLTNLVKDLTEVALQYSSSEPALDSRVTLA